MPTSRTGSLSTADDHEISNGDNPSEIESDLHGAGYVDPRSAVRLVCIVDAVERLHLVRGRDDRLPAERLANQLAIDVRALDEVRLDDEFDGAEAPWGELADAIAACAADPLGDKLAQVVDRLSHQISDLLREAPGEHRPDEPRSQEPRTAVPRTDELRA